MDALGEIRDIQAIKPLIAALRDENDHVSAWNGAVDALVKIGVPAVDALIVSLKDKDKWVRSQAVSALGNIGDTRAIEPLIEALKEDEGYGYVREAAANALVKIGLPAVDALIVVLKDKDKWVRWWAVHALRDIGSTRAVEPLLVALKDEDSSVQSATTYALGDIRDPIAVEPLIVTLKDRDWEVQCGAAEALGEISDARSLDAVTKLMQEADGSLKISCFLAAKEAIEKIRQAQEQKK